MLPKTILVTDDQAHILKLVEFSLEEINCWIETARSGEEAVSKAGRMQVDLLVIDVSLPGIDGFETVRRIKETAGYCDLPVIILTGQGQGDVQAQASGLGVTAFFTKPFSPNELATKARILLAL
jgi:DNA-binding response OmpR family regulator